MGSSLLIIRVWKEERVSRWSWGRSIAWCQRHHPLPWRLDCEHSMTSVGEVTGSVVLGAGLRAVQASSLCPLDSIARSQAVSGPLPVQACTYFFHLLEALGLPWASPCETSFPW